MKLFISSIFVFRCIYSSQHPSLSYYLSCIDVFMKMTLRDSLLSGVGFVRSTSDLDKHFREQVKKLSPSDRGKSAVGIL
jgi:hypothetical protein